MLKSDTHGSDSPTTGELAILAAIVLVATLLRIHALGTQLWTDEIIMRVRYGHLSTWQLLTTYDSQNHHILFTLLVHLSVWLFGGSPAAIRAPAVLFGVASVVAVYALGRQLRGVREGLLAAALLAFSYHHIWFSQNARGYTALLFWTLLSSIFLLRAPETGSPRLWSAYAVAAALGAYTHVTMLFVIAGHLITALPRRAGRVGLTYGFGLCGLLVTLLYAPIFPQLLDVTREQSVGKTIAWMRPTWAAGETVRGLEMALRYRLALIGGALLFAAGLWRLARERSVLLELLFLPTVIGAAVTIGTNHRLFPRFFFFAAGFAALVIVEGTTVLGETAARLLGRGRQRAALAGTLLCMAIILGGSLALGRVYAPKQDFLGALDLLDRERRPEDAVAVVGSAHRAFIDYYGRDYVHALTGDDLQAVQRTAPRTWVLYTFPIELAGVHPDIKEVLDRDFVVVDQFGGTLGGGTVFVARSERKP